MEANFGGLAQKRARLAYQKKRARGNSKLHWEGPVVVAVACESPLHVVPPPPCFYVRW
jgi:hypothetical protein